MSRIRGGGSASRISIAIRIQVDVDVDVDVVGPVIVAALVNGNDTVVVI